MYLARGKGRPEIGPSYRLVYPNLQGGCNQTKRSFAMRSQRGDIKFGPEFSYARLKDLD